MKKFIFDIKKYNKFVMYSAKCSLKSEVAGSRLSWLWWILDPLMFMLVYMFVALIVFNRGEQYFPLFVFIGLSVWQFFEKTVKGCVKVVTNNSAIVTKVYLPKYLLVLHRMLVHGFKMAVSFLIVVLMMFVFQVPVSWVILYVIPLFLVLFLVTFGIGTVFMHFGVFLEDLSNLVNIGLKLIFYLSGIFYSISNRVPEEYGVLLLKCNPIAFVIDELRNVMLYKTQPDIVALIIWLLVGLLLSIVAVRTVYKYENSYVKVI